MHELFQLLPGDRCVAQFPDHLARAQIRELCRRQEKRAGAEAQGQHGDNGIAGAGDIVHFAGISGRDMVPLAAAVDDRETLAASRDGDGGHRQSFSQGKFRLQVCCVTGKLPAKEPCRLLAIVSQQIRPTEPSKSTLRVYRNNRIRVAGQSHDVPDDAGDGAHRPGRRRLCRTPAGPPRRLRSPSGAVPKPAPVPPRLPAAAWINPPPAQVGTEPTDAVSLSYRASPLRPWSEADVAGHALDVLRSGELAQGRLRLMKTSGVRRFRLSLLALTLTLAACAGSSPPSSPTASAPSVVVTTQSSAPPVSGTAQRALVLGSGGPVGRAWEVGMLKALRDAGVDVSQADLVVGTSAGAIVGTQVRSGKTLDSLYNAQVATAANTPPPSASEPAFDATYAQQTQAPIRTATELTPALRMQVGQKALAAPKVISEDEWVKTITTSLGGDIHSWPDKPLKIAAGDVTDGTIRFFDRTQGVPIERAVAASSAPPGVTAPITIGDRRYMDGFVGGGNIDGAAGAGIILILTPTGSGSPGPVLQAQIDRARSQGSQVLNISPDADSRAAMGTNNLDLSKQSPATQAGARQGGTVAHQVKAFWTSSASAKPTAP